MLVAPGGNVADLGGAFANASDGAVVAFTEPDPGAAGGASTVTRGASYYGAWAVVGAAIGAANGTAGAYDASDAGELIGSVGQ